MSGHQSAPHYGMDHDRYAWSMLSERAPLVWPERKPLALWLNISLEHFGLDGAGEGVKAHGTMTMPYPDLRHYTLRDYGNRVGVFRVVDALRQRGFEASFAINGHVALRYPSLVQHVAASGAELLGHGWDMDHVHSSAIDGDREREWVSRARDALLPFSNAPLRGWLSPARSQSAITPELIREAGFDWCADWVNDELPYRFATTAGPLVALPLSHELEDRFVIGENGHAESEWADQIIDAGRFLIDEATRTGAGRLLSLSLTPWIIGQPHRIKHLERVLDELVAQRAGLWNVAPSTLVDHVLSQGVLQ